MSNINFRSNILKTYEAQSSQVEELLHYNENLFNYYQQTCPFTFPLPDELHVATWNNYMEEAQKDNLMNILKRKFPQFKFPIKEGISQTEEYKAATRRGILPENYKTNGHIKFKNPGQVRLIIHQSLAGNIPVFFARNREDFIQLVRAFTMKNEPKPIPDSMGACMVAGFNNWDRIHRLRKQWEAENSDNGSEAGWQAEFKRIIPQRELYQDRFIILSNGPYSGVPASELGLTEDKWKEMSLTIRLEHECAHYFTRRFFSSMQNNIFDELIADYMGITSALGYYRANWFLRFLGLENFPKYRKGGRMENYRGDPPLSDRSFQILQALVKDAAINLERFSNVYIDEDNIIERLPRMLLTITRLTIEELASSKSFTLLQEAFTNAERKVEYAQSTNSTDVPVLA